MDSSKYQMILDDLIAAIREGDFKANDQLPSERILAERYQVARATARRALSNLSGMGLVVRRGRQGTIVLPSAVGTSLQTVNLICAAEPLSSVSDFLRWCMQYCEEMSWQAKITRVAVNDEAAIMDALALGMRNIFFAAGFELGLSVKIQRALSRAADRTVILAERMDVSGVPSVVGDDLSGTRMALDALRAMGHRKIALITGGESIDHSILQIIHGEWKRQMENFMSAQDLKDCIVQIPHRPFYDLALCARPKIVEFLQSAHARGVTALFCLYEEISIGALAACRQVQLEVPQSITVMGYALTQRAQLHTPQISGVSVRIEQHVAKAFALLQEGLAHACRGNVCYQIDPEFCEGASAAGVPFLDA